MLPRPLEESALVMLDPDKPFNIFKVDPTNSLVTEKYTVSPLLYLASRADKQESKVDKTFEPIHLIGPTICFPFKCVAEAIFIITGAVKDICGKPPTERVFLDKYGRICLCLDEIVWNGLLENTDKDRIKRLIRLKPPSEF
ncbi:hypothetical protein F2Q69_00063324 [Brassica cretica]|uniref:Coatomer subunit zeta n=1 Tax=Brassica cretica TaxID=69181 RepID=A0A8S9RC68_BRACR|nr:hypothetical protein F2Q69_00063324 [Brassica cretica]